MNFDIADIVISPWIPIFWGVLVGFVFSTVGAAGGILASVGLISVLSIQNPNLVKPMAQMLTLVTPIIAVPLYYRQCRVIISLALILGVGGILGAIIGSTLSLSYLSDMSVYKPVFGVLVILIAAQVAWQLLNKTKKSTDKADRASSNFEKLIEQAGKPCSIGIKHRLYSLREIQFNFSNEVFSFNPIWVFLTGMGIAIFSSAFGVGGGFLLVPFMSIILRLPMFIIAGTSALAIMIHSLTSIANYMRLGIELDFPLLGLLLVGTIIGAFAGPTVSKFLPERWLRGILCAILIVIGLRYLGFF